MALIKCPECSRENVSDSAESCPDCGYGIKAHFDKIKREEQKEQQLKAEIEIRKRQEERIRSIPQPEKPVFSKGFLVYMIIVGILFLLILYVHIHKIYSDLSYLVEWFLEISVFIGVPFVSYYSSFSKSVKKYNLAQLDFEEYQRQIFREQDAAMASAQIAATTKSIKPECPYCHSYNTTKITTTAKVVNIAMFGLLGQKRKYQWHCNKCKSDF